MLNIQVCSNQKTPGLEEQEGTHCHSKTEIGGR